MDPDAVPPALRRLIPDVQRWSPAESDSELYDVADWAEADDARIAELESFAAAWTPELLETYERWQDEAPLTESYERAKFYFMFGLLDAVDVKLPREPSEPIAAAMRELERSGGRGDAPAMRRMWAIRALAERGPEAAAAVDVLRKAISDPDARVRAWSHAALALVTGEEGEHRPAIEAILAHPALVGLERSFAAAALKELDRTPKQRALRRLFSAAIMNDVEAIRRLASQVDVNATNADGSTAIALAVGNTHPDAVAALLKAGADPNGRDRFGDKTLLHDAAARRNGAAIIDLLLRHGADPRLADKEGNTPLDVARRSGWQLNTAQLEAAMR